MEDVISNLCSLLEKPIESDMQEALLRVAFAFENYKGFPSDAWPDEIKSISVSQEDAFYLKEKLINFIQSRPSAMLLGTSVWAFGKIADKHDKAFLDEILEENVEGDSEVLYQIMCALGNIGVRLFNSGESSMLNIEENRAAAKKYLANK